MQSIQTNHKQQGFTLIELMIVVAIIGILAAIAIPQYQDYIARSQMNRAYGELSALKTAAEESLMRGGQPSDVSDVGYTDSNILTSESVDFTGGDGSGSISADLGGNASTAVNGATINIDRTVDGEWSCTITTPGGGWDDSFAPTGCTTS